MIWPQELAAHQWTFLMQELQNAALMVRRYVEHSDSNFKQEVPQGLDGGVEDHMGGMSLAAGQT